MVVDVNFKILNKHGLTVVQFFTIYFIYYKQFDNAEEFLGRKIAIEARDSLLDTPFILSEKCKFTETILDKAKVEKLLGITNESVNFAEFYEMYPIKVGSRILRSTKDISKKYQDHKKKYLSKVKTEEQHKLAMASIEAFVAAKRRANELKFLPSMDTVLNQALWESWEVLIESELKTSNWDTVI